MPINSIKDNVKLEAGENVTITQEGQTLIISASIAREAGKDIDSNPELLKSAGGGNPGSGKPWKTFGNDDIDDSQNFLGTTENEDLVIITNNTEELRVTTGNGVKIRTVDEIASVDANTRVLVHDTANDDLVKFKTVSQLALQGPIGPTGPTGPTGDKGDTGDTFGYGNLGFKGTLD